MMNKILREHLIISLKGGNAFVPFSETLKNVEPQKRNIWLNDSTHSIWEELEHMRITQEDIVNYILDPNWVSPEWPTNYWPERRDNISDTDWNVTFNGFFNDLRKTIDIVKNEKIDLLSIIPHTKEHTYLREILLVIEHNAYHIGKILDIRKSLGDWK